MHTAMKHGHFEAQIVDPCPQTGLADVVIYHDSVAFDARMRYPTEKVDQLLTDLADPRPPALQYRPVVSAYIWQVSRRFKMHCRTHLFASHEGAKAAAQRWEGNGERCKITRLNCSE